MKRFQVWMAGILVLAGMIYSQATVAQKTANNQDWQLLGKQTVDYTLDYDAIPVTYKQGAFTTLRFAVADGSINVYRCMITFENGEKQEIEIKYQFTPGSEKIIDLKGNNRIIEKISFWYDTKNKSSKKAVIEVWGKK